MKEKIIQYLEEKKECKIRDLEKIVRPKSSKEFTEMVKSLNELEDEKLIYNDHTSLYLIDDIHFMAGSAKDISRYEIAVFNENNKVYVPKNKKMKIFDKDEVLVRLKPEPSLIKVFNHGKMERDFTYIDDIVEGIVKLIDKAPAANIEWDESKDDLSTSFAPYKIYNIGNNNPVQLMRFINALESALGKEVEKIYMDMQPGDVLRTYADVSDLERDINFKPSTSIEDGLKKFVEWYEDYYKVEK